MGIQQDPSDTSEVGLSGSGKHFWKREQRGELSRDEMFDLLRNSRRRDVLLYLDSLDDGQTTISDLAERIAAKENDSTVEEVTSDQRKRVYIGLYQGHLPRLAEHDIIEYDQNRGTVELLDMSQFRPHLYESPGAERSKLPIYGAIAVAGVVGIGLVGIDAVPAAAWAVLSTVALLLYAAYQYW